jgi:LysM repeat protein
MRRTLVFSLILLSGCGSNMTAWHQDNNRNDLVLEEMRLEIADLKHSLHGAKVDLQLLDEKIKSQDLKASSKTATKNPELSLQLANLERKVQELQRNQERLTADIKQLGAHTNQASARIREIDQEIAAQNKRLEEVVKLKGTLTSLSQVLKEKSKGDTSSKRYKVKSGDSLEKIAKQQGTSIDVLKKLNELSSDRIVVGQEILLPNE